MSTHTSGRFCSFAKDGDTASLHLKGVGTFGVPQGVQDGLNAASDEWLLDNLHQHGFVDPFVLGEICHRGLYAEAERRRLAKLPKPKTIGEILFGDTSAKVNESDKGR